MKLKQMRRIHKSLAVEFCLCEEKSSILSMLLLEPVQHNAYKICSFICLSSSRQIILRLRAASPHQNDLQVIYSAVNIRHLPRHIPWPVVSRNISNYNTIIRPNSSRPRQSVGPHLAAADGPRTVLVLARPTPSHPQWWPLRPSSWISVGSTALMLLLSKA